MNIIDNKLENISFQKSPNQYGNIIPEYIIIHDTASKTEMGAVSWMLNPKSDVSAHVHISREGNIIQLVEFNQRAYHAGFSNYKGRSDFNWFSIGIELQNTGDEVYTDLQLNSLLIVCRALIKKYPSIKEILGHKEIAPNRKVDPNPFFPMTRLRELVFNEQ